MSSTPDKMNHWDFARDQLLLIIKSIALPKSAEAGIFKVHSHTYEGFQYGNPQFRKDDIVVDLYSDDGSVEMIFLQKNYRNAIGVTQPEVNRIAQSLRKTTQESPVVPRMANR